MSVHKDDKKKKKGSSDRFKSVRASFGGTEEGAQAARSRLRREAAERRKRRDKDS